MNVRVRLAPSPTGNLHIGTARTALFNWLFAKSNKGKFLIRIEDTDLERSKEEYVKNIFDGMQWLGLNWDEDPVIQSTRTEKHETAIQKLLELGLAYRCYATDQELNEMRDTQKQEGKPQRYDNRHRNLSKNQEEIFKEQGRTSVVRFKIEDEEQIEWTDLIRGDMRWLGCDLGGDMVISRRAPVNKIGSPLYNLVVVIDDADMNISHVIRGEDHLSNTAKQILLYNALGLTQPKFAHTPLILNSEGKKLSKRDGVTSIDDFRKMGYTPEAMANYMTLLGWSVPEGQNERFTLKEISGIFNFDRVNKAGAKFDWDKLNWLNSQVIHDMSNEKLLKSLKSNWEKEGWNTQNKEWCLALAELLKTSLTVLKDGVTQARPFFEEPKLNNEAIKQLDLPRAKESMKILLEQLNRHPWDGMDHTHANELIQNISKDSGIKKGLIMKTLRAALLGELQGPDLLTTWGLLARARKDRDRLGRALL